MGAQVSARKRLRSDSCSLGRAPAQSSATLTGEYRITASELLNSIHVETTSTFLPRETSIRMSESTRTVIFREADPNGHLAEDCECTPRRQWIRRGSYGFRRIPAVPSPVPHSCPDTGRAQHLARAPSC